MVTEKTAGSGEDSGAENVPDTPQTLEEASAKITELSSALQKASQEISVMRGRVRASQVTQGAVEELGSRFQKSMEDGLRIVLETDDPDERAERYKEWARQNVEADNRARAISKHQNTLLKLVEDNNVDFENDEDFEEVREAWNGPNPETAIPLARLAVKSRDGSGYSREQVQQEIQTALRNANLSNASVDTSGGGGSQVNSGPRPSSLSQLAEQARENRQGGKPMTLDEIKAAARSLRRQ